MLHFVVEYLYYYKTDLQAKTQSISTLNIKQLVNNQGNERKLNLIQSILKLSYPVGHLEFLYP